MNKEQFLRKTKAALDDILEEAYDEIIENTAYDLLNFDSKEEEKEYLDHKTSNYDIESALLDCDDNDGIIVITEKDYYAVSPVFIHSDAFIKLHNFIYNENKKNVIGDVIEKYTNRGNILIRVVNNSGILGFDSYIPEKINDYQFMILGRVLKDLNSVYKEIENVDDMNSKNIKYGINTIRASIKEKTLEKKL